MHVLWIIGTAAQNNPSAQDAYLALNPLPVITAFLTPSPSSTLQTRSKAIYALSALLKHNSTAVRELSNPNVDGWSRLRNALQDPDIAVRRKTIFLLGTLLIPTTPSSTPAPLQPGLHTPSSAPPSDPIHANSHAVHLKDPSRTNTSEPSLAAFRDHGLLEAVVSALTNPFPYGEDGDVQEPDPTFEEQGVRLLHIYVVLARGQILDSEKETLRKFIETERKKEGEKALAERWNLGLQELQELIANL